MGVCSSTDLDENVWQFSIKKQDSSVEERRLQRINDEIVAQQRKLDMLNNQVARVSTVMAEGPHDKSIDIADHLSDDVNYLLNTGNLQGIFPSLSEEELSKLLHMVMLINTHTHSLYSKGSTARSSIRGSDTHGLGSSSRRSSYSSAGRISINNQNSLRIVQGRAYSPESETTDRKHEDIDAEESGSSLASLRQITFRERPFGFQIALPDPDIESSHNTLPYVFSVTNEYLRSMGVCAGMSLFSVDGVKIAPGSSLRSIQNILTSSPLPCTMAFCLPEGLSSPVKQYTRRKYRKKRKRKTILCPDCNTYTKKKISKKGPDGKYYCRSCHKCHVCEYCKFWALEVDKRRGVIFCDECMVAEKFITFSGFPLPFSLRPDDGLPVIHDVDPNDSLGLYDGWILTTVNDQNVTGQTSYDVISILAGAEFPLTLGFKRTNVVKDDVSSSNGWSFERQEVGGEILGKKDGKSVRFPDSKPNMEPITHL